MLKNYRSNKNKGFSLVELIVVIAIMVVLLSMLVPNVVGYIEKANKLSAMNTVKVMVNAMELSLVEHTLSGELRVNKQYKFKNGTEYVDAGCLSNYMLYRAQKNTGYSKTAVDYADYVIAQDILEAVNSTHDAKNPVLKFKNDTRGVDKTIATACSNGSDNAIFIYSPTGGCYYAQVCIQGTYLVTYESGDYEVENVSKQKNTKKMISGDKIKGW